jgi:hypothetical protein
VKPSEELREACEKIWEQKGVSQVYKKAKWCVYRGRLVPFVAKKYRSDLDITYTEDK